MEDPVNWNGWIRQTHRWVSIALHRDRHRELHRAGTAKWDAAPLGDLFAAAPARLAPVHRPVSVRAAVCGWGARRARRASEPRARSEPAQRRARARVRESEGRSPSDK